MYHDLRATIAIVMFLHDELDQWRRNISVRKPKLCTCKQTSRVCVLIRSLVGSYRIGFQKDSWAIIAPASMTKRRSRLECGPFFNPCDKSAMRAPYAVGFWEKIVWNAFVPSLMCMRDQQNDSKEVAYHINDAFCIPHRPAFASATLFDALLRTVA